MTNQKLTTKYDTSPDTPTFCHDAFKHEWLMTRWEKFALESLLKCIKPSVALEIGTYKGGSLQVISQHATHVISVDMISEPKETLANEFPNVDFRVGDSSLLVPQVISELSVLDASLNFVLIDGDHTTEGVRRDIESVLKYKPQNPLFIVMHDSFHPQCREGMLSVNWGANPFVDYVEIDFIPGVYYQAGTSKIKPGSMYGGFAIAKLMPSERKGPLLVSEGQRSVYSLCLADSLRLSACAEQGTNKPTKSLISRIKHRLRMQP